MAWQLTGQMIESCSCNMFCPCWFGVKELMVMDQGWCDMAIAFRIQQGSADGVDLSSLTVVLAEDFPGPTIFDGNGTARLYIDDRATADQRLALEAIFTGKQGGPMAALGPLVAQWLPSQTAQIDISETGDTITVMVGSVGRVQSRLLRDMEGKSFTLQGGGEIGGMGMQAIELAPSTSRWSDPDLPRAFETKSGARGSFTWMG